MNFIEGIKRYQAEGDRYIFDMIRREMNYNYLKSPTGMDLPRPEMYVAFRLLRLISGMLATIKYRLTEEGTNITQVDPEYIFADYGRQLLDWTGIRLTVENFPEHASYLREYYVSYVFSGLYTAYRQLIGELPTLQQVYASELIDKVYEPLMVPALEYALKRVDTSRTEREIVRYINFAVRTEYFQQQVRGMRRVRRAGQSKYVDPHSRGANYAILGKYVDERQLTANQADLFRKICRIIEEDFKGGHVSDYNVDIDGIYRIKNRYIARRIGVHEGSLSRSLRKMRERLNIAV